MRATLDDFLKLPEGTLAEFIGGEILMSPSPRTWHQELVSRVYRALSEFARPRKLGRAFQSPLDVYLPGGDVVQPDVLFVSTARLSIVGDWIRGAPDLVVEVLSPETRRRDLRVKPGIYAGSGVAEYWIVDPEARSVELRHATGRHLFAAAPVLVSELLPGFELPLAALFAKE
jgi:Uma2 family endonuclease